MLSHVKWYYFAVVSTSEGCDSNFEVNISNLKVDRNETTTLH